MIEKLQLINESLLKSHQNDAKELKKYKLIQQILRDKDCFFKMKMEVAFALLRDLKIKEEDLKSVYVELIDIKYMKKDSYDTI